MINKSLPGTSDPIKQQSTFNELSLSPSHNATTNKLRSSRRRLEQQLEIEPPESHENNSPLSHLSRLIEDDAPIEQQPSGIEIIPSPQKDCVSSPRRSLIKQNELWSSEQCSEEQAATSPRKQLLLVSDEYYNEGVPLQTMNFLQRLRDILLREEDNLTEKRKGRVQSAISTIRGEFARLRQEMLFVVDDWCRRTEQAQVGAFVQSGEISANGEMVELAARLTSRREEIEQRLGQLAFGSVQSHLTPKEETLRSNATVKKVVRQVWMRDYQYEVLQLQQQALAVGSLEKVNKLVVTNGDIVQRELFQALHGVLTQYNSFKFVQNMQENNPKPQVKTISPPVHQKKEEESLSPASENQREQVLQSLLEEKRREIHIESQRMLSQYQFRSGNQ